MKNTIKTVRRNSKKLDLIWKNGKDGNVLSLGNNFCRQVRSIELIKDIYEAYSFAKLTHNDQGKYTLSLTSNEWYEFQSIFI